MVLPTPSRLPSQVGALCIGASAGGVRALLTLLDGLPARFRLPVFIVLHMPDDHNSGLPDLFAQRLRVDVREAADKMPIVPGTIYFAPPGYHLQVERDRSFSLSCEPPVHFSRPSIDVLFETAAFAYGSVLAALLLTGASEDGASGLATVGIRGGFTAAQDPEEAQIPTMPQAAIALRVPDRVLPLAGLRQLIADLNETPPPPC